MGQLGAQVLSEDLDFKRKVGRLLRSGPVPVSVIEDAAARDHMPELLIVDIRGDASSAMPGIERLRAAAPASSIFAVALSADPDLILQAMRAGANEFFVWPPADETFHGAIRRTAARREVTQGAKPAATTLVFFGAKGGAGTTTVAVNTGVELARLTGGARSSSTSSRASARSRSFWASGPGTACSTPSTTCTGSTASS